MAATLLLRERVVLGEDSFVELVLWKLSSPLPGSRHAFKYRLAYVRGGLCLLRHDNEAGKGDHRHTLRGEAAYAFESPEKLVDDFMREARRIDDEDRGA